MSEIPADIMQAAYDCARGIYLSVDDAYIPYLTDNDIEEIAKAILVERQRADSCKALCDELAKAGDALIADVRARYPGEELRCQYMRALDAALAAYRKEKEVGNG